MASKKLPSADQIRQRVAEETAIPWNDEAEMRKRFGPIPAESERWREGKAEHVIPERMQSGNLSAGGSAPRSVSSKPFRTR